MRTTLTAVFMIALALPAFGQTPAGGADEAAIRKLVQQHDTARNTSDFKALGGGFTDDADQLTSAGEWRKGRAAIEKGVAQGIAGPYKGGKYTHEDRHGSDGRAERRLGGRFVRDREPCRRRHAPRPRRLRGGEVGGTVAYCRIPNDGAHAGGRDAGALASSAVVTA